MSRRTISAAVLGGLLATGCTWVALGPRAEAVNVRAAGDVAGCKRLGKTHTRTLDKVGFIPRRGSKVEEELERLARQEAVNMGGNAVSPLEDVASGERVYGIYSCP